MSVIPLPTPPPKQRKRRTKKPPPPSKSARFKSGLQEWIEAKKWRADTASYLLYFNNHLKEFFYAAFLAVVISITVIVGMRYLYPSLFVVEVESLTLKVYATDGQKYVCRPER